ncbi:zf-TFIIB domain-containing protein [Rahnella sp. PCH160]|uniref:TFIIB-type zinc ribbon-containing protein n=1 Tax=Rahnella sp. PCH160 TaxID=3447928 RepID=UPI0039FD5780
MQCPVCKESQLVMSERQGIEIDYCPDCRGVWLDRGELDKIIEKSAVIHQPERPSATRYEEPNRHDDHRPHSGHENRGNYSSQKPYKKKSFLSELFD